MLRLTRQVRRLRWVYLRRFHRIRKRRLRDRGM